MFRFDFDTRKPFSQAWQKNGNTLKDLFVLNDGELHSKPTKREVRSFQLDGDTYYLKRSPFEGFRKFWRLKSKTPPVRTTLDKERQIIRLFEQANIPVMQVVAYGEKKFLGIPVASLLVVNDVKGRAFQDVFTNETRTNRRKLAAAFGSLTAAVHNAGINSIVRIFDVLCTSRPSTNYRDCLAVIDREHGDLRQQPLDRKTRATQIARVYTQSIQHCKKTTRVELLAFLSGYLNSAANGEKQQFPKDVLTQIIERLSAPKRQHTLAQVQETINPPAP